MQRQELYEQIQQKKSFLCIGLDTDMERIPASVKQTKDPVFAFNKAIIDATHELCVAYKLNTAFYEAQGAKGWESMAKTVDYIPGTHFTIADAKRGDIGNTCHQYARAFFQQLDFDAVTLSPYLGQDSVAPFLEYEDKWVIILALTSNQSSSEFQLLQDERYRFFEHVLNRGRSWGTTGNTMFVVGATQSAHIERIREIIPEHFLLVPGIGAQGGSLEEVCKFGITDQCGLLVNSSRSIIYAGKDENFAGGARKAAEKVSRSMEKYVA